MLSTGHASNLGPEASAESQNVVFGNCEAYTFVSNSVHSRCYLAKGDSYHKKMLTIKLARIHGRRNMIL